MVDIVTVEGPLEPARRRWIGELYGNADPKFRRDDVLEHLFVRSPAGPGLHAFALDGVRAVGHCAVVPLRTRLGAGELRSGKLEALWVEGPYRGRQPDGQTLVRALLDRLYDFADERGFVLVHAIATERIGGVIDFVPLGEVGEPSRVAIVSRDAPALGRGMAGRALVGAHRAFDGLARAALPGSGGALLREVTAADADLAAAPQPPPGRWSVLAGDAWDWYRTSPLLRVLEAPGRHGSRALVQLPGVAGQPLRVIGWRPAQPGLRPALRLLAEARRLARESRAGSLRCQPWPSAAGNGDLARACRLLGFVRRNDLTALWVRTSEPALEQAGAVVPTPLLYLAF